MCSLHFAQQPQVGLLNTATVGLPAAAGLPGWLLTTAPPMPATRTTAEASATAAERIIIMVPRSYPWSRKKATMRRGKACGWARHAAVCVAPDTRHSVAAGWARASAAAGYG